MAVTKRNWAIIKIGVFMLSTLPFLRLSYAAITNNLGANPIEALHFGFGDWALRFLCISLALSPYKAITGQTWTTRFRRMIGLFAFFYASMHLLVYVVLDLSLSWQEFTEEVPKSPYILMGLLTFLLLTPLAFTSTKTMQKRLGKTWSKVHRLIYVAAFTAVLHYFWLVKLDYRQPLLYAVIVLVLLAIRVPGYLRKNQLKKPTRKAVL